MGAVTMKMISSTSITSTSGVTLMSPRTLSSGSPLVPKWKAMSRAVPDRLGEIAPGEVHELDHEVFHVGAQPAQLDAEVVEADQRRDGGAETGRGVDQGFGDAWRHRHDRGRAGLADVAEGAHDAPHGAEQADEGRRRGGGGEEVGAPRQQPELDPEGAAQAALDRVQRLDLVPPLLGGAGRLAARLDLRVDLGIAGMEEAEQRRGEELARRGAHLAETLALVEDLQEPVAVRRGALELHELGYHHRSGDHREEHQDQQHRLGHRAGGHEEIEQARAGSLLDLGQDHQARRHPLLPVARRRKGSTPERALSTARAGRGRIKSPRRGGTGMRIAVCIKQVPDTEARLRVRRDGKWVEEADLPFVLNESDEYALEESLRLVEKHDGEVVVFSLGPERVREALRKALALGAARAVHLRDEAFAGGDALATGRALAAAVARESFDLVLTGSQSDDAGYGATGSVVAGHRGWPHAWLVT